MLNAPTDYRGSKLVQVRLRPLSKKCLCNTRFQLPGDILQASGDLPNKVVVV